MAERKDPSYFAAARHPWACFLFLLPLFAVYEFGIVWIGGPNPDALRNGADVWTRWFLTTFGLGQLWAAPLLVLGLFLVRAVASRKDRPRMGLSAWFGMLVESVLYAIVLWGISRNFQQLLDLAGLPLTQIQFKTVAAGQFVTFIGAGIYEEVLFRLGLFSLFVLLLRLALMPTVVAVPVAACVGAVVFAAAHHVYGQPIQPPVFVFRAAAGLFFTILYVFRGFGIAVGAHAGYDILVGVAVEQH